MASYLILLLLFSFSCSRKIGGRPPFSFFIYYYDGYYDGGKDVQDIDSLTIVFEIDNIEGKIIYDNGEIEGIYYIFFGNNPKEQRIHLRDSIKLSTLSRVSGFGDYKSKISLLYGKRKELIFVDTIEVRTKVKRGWNAPTYVALDWVSCKRSRFYDINTSSAGGLNMICDTQRIMELYKEGKELPIR